VRLRELPAQVVPLEQAVPGRPAAPAWRVRTTVSYAPWPAIAALASRVAVAAAFTASDKAGLPTPEPAKACGLRLRASIVGGLSVRERKQVSMTKRWLAGLVGVVLSALVIGGGCGEKNPAVCSNAEFCNGSTSLGGGGSSGNASLGGKGTGAANSGTGGRSAALKCSDAGACAGPSRCDDSSGRAVCTCNEGYVFEKGSTSTCVVDKTCIKIKPLGDDSCRQLVGGISAVAAFFAVDYCAGTAVLEADLAPLAAVPGDLNSVFKVSENGAGLKDSESKVTIIPRDVESYVTIALDVSNSITVDQPAFFAALLGKLQTLVQALKPLPGKPDVGVSVLIFGKTVAELVPFTTDLDAVSAAVGTLKDSTVITTRVPADGTALIEAANTGVTNTERIIALRNGVTQGGILSTGTLILVTDGKDNSGTMPSSGLTTTSVNLVSVGVGPSEMLDGTLLKTLGRDGAFSAPAPADLDIAFAEITKRVAEYPDRAYLLGYCSPSVTGTPAVTISLTKLEVKATASCTFNPALFNATIGQTCDAAFFTGECANRKCGGLTACGKCTLDTECCVGATGQCAAPAAAADCQGDSTLCGPGPSECITDTCSAPLDTGAKSPLGAECALASDCESQRCERANLVSITSMHVCKRPAQIGELCSGMLANAVCEDGSACVGETCQARGLVQCTTQADCLSGACTPGAQGAPGFCTQINTCQFSWDSKNKK